MKDLMKVFSLILFVFVVVAHFIMPLFAIAQDVVDPMDAVSRIFSPGLVVMIGAIVGFTKMIRNTVNLKGPFAVVVTVIVSIGYALVQYRAEGLGVAILVGIVAAGVSAGGFWITKWLGRNVVNPEGTK